MGLGGGGRITIERMPGREGDARYRRFPAPVAVAAYVEHVWMVEAPARPAPQREILIPSARPSVVTCLAEPGVRRDPLTEAAQPNANVVFGLTTRPYVLEQRGPASYVGAQLTPWGLAALFTRDRLVDEFLPLDRWLGSDVVTALDGRLAAEEFGQERADVLTDFLRTLITPVQPRTLRLLHRLVTAVDRTGGQISIGRLAADLGVSSSTVYRLCNGNIGLAPKVFCEVVRYYHFVGGLLDDTTDSDAILASLHGYYDQAHAARDFKRYTGVTASSFRQINNGIARLMHTE